MFSFSASGKNSKLIRLQDVTFQLCFKRQIWDVLFFGNDNFSVRCLEKLHERQKINAYIRRLDVVSTERNNVVKAYAAANNLQFQPWQPTLCDSLSTYDVGIVVSFGHLIPKKIIKKFPLGMINVHASLLPRWRGASPMVHSLMHGDSETGISIMTIEPHHFDMGKIVLQKKCAIDEHELLPSLHEKLAKLGSECLIEAIEGLPQSVENAKSQSIEGATHAPKIDANLSKIDWTHQTSDQIYNLYRGLYGITSLRTSWKMHPVKLKSIIKGGVINSSNHPGGIRFNRSSKNLIIQCKEGTIIVESLTIGGKAVNSADFFNGYLSKVPYKDWIFV